MRFLLVLLGFWLSAIAQGQDAPVWFWSERCPSGEYDSLALVASVEGRTLFEEVVPVCRELRARHIDGKEKHIIVPFKLSKAIAWEDEDGETYRIPAKTEVDLDLWQAGAEPEGLILGVSVSDNARVYLNTLFMAKPSSLGRTELVGGLALETRPVSGGGRK